MSGKFTISANILQAVLNKLGDRPYVEVETLINAIRNDVKPLEEKEETKPKEVPKKKE